MFEKEGKIRSKRGGIFALGRALDRSFEAAILGKQSRSREVSDCFCFYLFLETGEKFL